MVLIIFFCLMAGSIKKECREVRPDRKSMQFDHIFPKGEFAVTEKDRRLHSEAAGMDFNLTDCLLDRVWK